MFSRQHCFSSLPQNHIPRRHTRAQLRHAHRDTLDEEPTDQPAPDHAAGARIAHAVGQRTGEAGQQPQHGERDAEGGPERELALELLLVAQGDQRGLVGGQTCDIGHVAIGHDRSDGGFARSILIRTHIAGVYRVSGVGGEKEGEGEGGGEEEEKEEEENETKAMNVLETDISIYLR